MLDVTKKCLIRPCKDFFTATDESVIEPGQIGYMTVILVYHKSLSCEIGWVCSLPTLESDSQRGLLIVRRSCGRNRSAQVGPEPDREGSHVGNRPHACQTVRGSVRSFVLTGTPTVFSPRFRSATLLTSTSFQHSSRPVVGAPSDNWL